MRILLIAILLFTGTETIHAQDKINSGEDIIRAMYEKYEGKWYEYLTFEQKTTFYNREGKVEREQTWFEAMTIPGKLAIKFDEIDNQNGVLFRNDVQYGFAEGELIQEMPRVHDLLVLGFDVYRQSPDSTIAKLQESGYDLSKFYEDEWQGRTVYVVGTDKKNEKVPQFWIDKERLLFVRTLKPGRQNTIQDTQFNKYERLGNGWIASEVIFKVNGQTFMHEEYSRINLPNTLNEAVFEPETFIESVW